ncbi:unnamed protein product, partial [Didymodactylos carnosus]
DQYENQMKDLKLVVKQNTSDFEAKERQKQSLLNEIETLKQQIEDMTNENSNLKQNINQKQEHLNDFEIKFEEK